MTRNRGLRQFLGRGLQKVRAVLWFALARNLMRAVALRQAAAPDAMVPIGRVAIGDPAAILPPHEHDRIWAIQEALDFPGTVFGPERAPSGETIMPVLTRRYCRALGRHHADRVLGYHASPDP